MNIVHKLIRLGRLLRELVRRRDFVRALLTSKNTRFLEFAAPGHFYSPIPDMADVESNAKLLFGRAAQALPGIDLNAAAQLQLLERLAPLYASMDFSDQPRAGHRFHLDNEYFSYGDGIMLHLLLRHLRPRRVVEIGSGFSSSAMLDTNDRFLGGEVEFTFVEPFPERLFSLLSDADKRTAKVEVKPVQAVDPAVFAALEAGDILFIDSSHVAKIGSDVLHLLFEVLPRLAPGVIVHFHDVPWPFEYPKLWLEDGRAWNEAYLLRAFLQYNSAFEILFFNSFVAVHHADLLQERMPAVLKTPSSAITPGNTSLWLRKTA